MNITFFLINKYHRRFCKNFIKRIATELVKTKKKIMQFINGIEVPTGTEISKIH